MLKLTWIDPKNPRNSVCLVSALDEMPEDERILPRGGVEYTRPGWKVLVMATPTFCRVLHACNFHEDNSGNFLREPDTIEDVDAVYVVSNKNGGVF